MSKIIISSPDSSTRLFYVCDFICNECFDLDYTLELNSSIEYFEIKADKVEQVIQLENSGLLFESGIKPNWITPMTNRVSMVADEKSTEWSSIDIFAMIFFFLSRYEEYTVIARDRHDRFMAISSCLHQAGCIEKPIVDILLNYLRDKIESELNIQCKQNESELISTIDIDFPWYRKHLKFPYYLKKEKTINNVDPYDTYDAIISAHQKIGIRPIFFFLCGGSPPFEKVNRYHQQAYGELIQTNSSEADIGIHPPYQSAVDSRAMKKAFTHFESLSNSRPTRSRQHYLRLKLPTTYRLLINEGIKEDYSMGFADRVGFRAGTARSFYWYDLLEEEKTDLRIVPLIAMDVTLRNYMSLSSEKSLAKLIEIKNTINRHGGNMMLLWHNSSLSDIDDWSEYAATYQKFISSFHE